jgi:hypothetical protein
LKRNARYALIVLSHFFCLFLGTYIEKNVQNNQSEPPVDTRELSKRRAGKAYRNIQMPRHVTVQYVYFPGKKFDNML